MKLLSALDRKLLRDLGRLGGQAITIALVVASGIATYVALQGNYTSLLDSQAAYYERYRFGDVFAHCKRAPDSLVAELEAVEGVANVYARVKDAVSVLLPDEPEPIAGAILSLPSDGSPPPMNALALQGGRLPDPTRGEEILLLDGFATAWNIEPGDRLTVVLNGRRRDLRVAGTALSPEYVMAVEPGGMIPDPNRFAVIWMTRNALAPSFELDGSFNDVVIDLQPGASADEVRASVDRMLTPYGSTGAIGRDRQESHYILNSELEGLEVQATVTPLIFLGVAAFLLNVVLSRLVHLQRPQIAALKALGYTDAAIGLHYLKLVTAIVLLGALLGTLAGYYMGEALAGVYAEYFKFPGVVYGLDLRSAVVGGIVSFLAAVVGALASVRRIASLPPAEAMRPPAPPLYRRGLLDGVGALRLFGQSARMIVREIVRRPMRTVMSSVGIAMAVAILVAGRFGMDSVENLIERTFQSAMTEDLIVAFTGPTPERAVRELGHLPGVERAEGLRMVAARFRHRTIERDALLVGGTERLTLRRLVDVHHREIPVPEDGVLLSRKLADILQIGVGDEVEVDILEGERGTHTITISGLIDDEYGLQGNLRIENLNRLMREDRMVSTALLDVDEASMDLVRERLRDRSGVLTVARRMAVIESFRKQTATWTVMTIILSVFAATIAVGVVYNNARVSLSMRSRDLASLRVLGFTRSEISAVLLGELAVQLLLAIPIGLLLGTWMGEGLMSAIDQERYRFQAVFSSQTYAFATLVVLGSGVVSALLVRRKLDQLDLIGVLKTRE